MCAPGGTDSGATASEEVRQRQLTIRPLPLLTIAGVLPAGTVAQGRRRGAGVGLIGRWFPRRRPPNRTCESPRIRLSMSTSGGFVSCERLLGACE
jgi:hypothetical protein